jgi:hypothetical protein
VGDGDVIDVCGVDAAGAPPHAPTSALERTTTRSQRHRCARECVPITAKLGRRAARADGGRA